MPNYDYGTDAWNRRRVWRAETTSQRCYGCEVVLPAGEFAPDASKASGRKSICRACDRAKSKRYYAANRERKLAKMAAKRRAS